MVENRSLDAMVSVLPLHHLHVLDCFCTVAEPDGSTIIKPFVHRLDPKISNPFPRVVHVPDPDNTPAMHASPEGPSSSNEHYAAN